MNPLSFITSPVNDLWRAVSMPLRAVFVIGLCFFINQRVSPWNPWWHWVAFGMGIAVLVAWARAFKTIVKLAIAFYVGRWIWRRYGDAAKARFDEWMSAGTTGGKKSRERDPKEVLGLIGNDAAVRQAGIVH